MKLSLGEMKSLAVACEQAPVWVKSELAKCTCSLGPSVHVVAELFSAFAAQGACSQATLAEVCHWDTETLTLY